MSRSLEKKPSEQQVAERKPIEARVLMEQEGLRITNGQVSTPAGDFPVRDIHTLDKRIAKPTWGPLALSLLGTLNLAIAFQSRFWLDFLAAFIMLGVGIFWWLRGTRYVLILNTAQEGPQEVWFSRREAQLRQAMEILQNLLDKRRARL